MSDTRKTAPVAPLRRDWLVFWNSQIKKKQNKTNKEIYHHIGVKFLLLESWVSWHLSPLAHNVPMSEKPRCQVKRHRSAWEITSAFKVAPW